MVDNQIDADIVQTIIALARALNVRVIAEGVETQVQQEFLRAHDCDIAQGYLLSTPVSHELIEQHFLERDKSSKLLPFRGNNRA